MYAVDRTPDIRLTSRCTPAAMPKVSVESSTRSTPSVPTVRRIRRTMLAFSVLGNTEACEMIRRNIPAGHGIRDDPYRAALNHGDRIRSVRVHLAHRSPPLVRAVIQAIVLSM